MNLSYVVTGANRGIGLEFARQLKERGSQVVATVRSPETARELEGLGVKVEALDLSQPESVRAFSRRLDGEPIDVLLNNAGVGGLNQPLAALDFERVENCLRVNSLGPIRLIQALLPNLRAGTAKLIVNITSQMGSIELNGGGGFYAYRTSKAALNMFTRSLSIELGPQGFVCILLHPGWVQTDMGGPAAPVKPWESVSGMLRVLGKVGPKDNGKFLDYRGRPLPW